MFFNAKDSIINSIEVVLMNLHEKEKMYQRLIILTLLICMVIYYFEKIVDFFNKGIPEDNISLERKTYMYLYANMFTICNRGIREVWFYEGEFFEYKTYIEMPPVCERWI